MNTNKTVADYIIDIPDFPEPGIIFRDITGVLNDADGLRLAIDEMQAKLEGVEFDKIIGLESRGFLLGMPIAYNLGKPFVPIRKVGKLPRATIRKAYDLEYGTAEIEVHAEDIASGERVVIIDDLIATGGTINAAANIVEALGANVVCMVCLLELKGLNGRSVLEKYDVKTVVQYEGK
ncbi:MAG: adenine phosphoribosyltransferase [Bacillota bacterium]|nr:adenine phosphoribosyltransferase [Bacillota bacterium]